MIYPKKSASNKVGGDSEDARSRRFLSAQQRDELKRVIAERLSKKYGIKYSDLINSELNNFMNQNKNITANALQELENNIKNATQPNQQKDTQNQKEKDLEEQSVKSGVSKMSGASNFDQVDQIIRQQVSSSEKAQNEEEMNKKNKNKDRKLQTMNVKKPENDLEFLKEEDEWAAIYKYNRFLYEKEQQLVKQRKEELKKKVRDDLDSQVKQKQDQKQKVSQENEKYAENLLIQLKRYDQRELERQEEVKKLREIEKAGRERQIKENKVRKRHEDKTEKALDAYLMQKVQEELEAEQKYQVFKKEHQAQVMSKLLQDNEEKKRQMREDMERERLENIKLQEAYNKLIEDQEKEREQNLQERDAKMKEFQKRALETVYQENEDKLANMEKRRERYEQRHEKKLDNEEKMKLEKIKQQKVDMKDYLFKQMDEKQQKRETEKALQMQQAQIWKEDAQKFQEYEDRKKDLKKQILNQYSSQLKTQMQDSKINKKHGLAKMNENETLLNKQLLAEIDKIATESEQALSIGHSGVQN